MGKQVSTSDGSIAVMIVDDHTILTEGLTRVFDAHLPEFKCQAFASAKQALAVLDAGRRFDLYLVDLKMPEVDGLQFLKALNARDILKPAVILSASDSRDNIRAAASAGARGYINKAMPPEEICDSLKLIVGGYRIFPDTGSNLDEAETGDMTSIGITQRQREILPFLERGLTNREIAAILNLSEPTVKTHVMKLFRRLGVNSRFMCVEKARREGLL